MSSSIPFYQRLRPCVDSNGHRFTASTVAPGNFGYVFIFCTRCGKKREDLA
jgi:hypothetical protein